MWKKILLGLLAVLVIMQFIRPDKNDSAKQPHPMSAKYTVPAEVNDLLKVACNDCHTNSTRYPWYVNIQPVGWWLQDHINHAKGHLNFDEFTHRPIAVQNHKFEEMIEEVDEHKMPLPSYTNFGLHAEADLSEAQRKTITDWAKAQMTMLAENYPADSLILRRKSPPPSE